MGREGRRGRDRAANHAQAKRARVAEDLFLAAHAADTDACQKPLAEGACVAALQARGHESK